MLAGAAMAGVPYLLARILFRRRAVGVFVAAVCLADGMFFVQSRIGMNDAYVGLGIVAAYTAVRGDLDRGRGGIAGRSGSRCR